MLPWRGHGGLVAVLGKVLDNNDIRLRTANMIYDGPAGIAFMAYFLIGFERMMPAIFTIALISVCSSAEIQKSSSSAEQASLKTDGDPGDQVLLDLYQAHKILAKPEYAKIRHVFAKRFEAAHDGDIRGAFGEPASAFRQWLDKQREIKEEFFLAIDPEHDDLPRALSLFKELHARFPDKFAEYANLAIAVAVVWDKEQGAIHGSPSDRAIMPEGQMGAVDNFEYYTGMEAALQGRIRYLPWEFLIHVVNHRTTLPERKWQVPQRRALRFRHAQGRTAENCGQALHAAQPANLRRRLRQPVRLRRSRG